MWHQKRDPQIGAAGSKLVNGEIGRQRPEVAQTGTCRIKQIAINGVRPYEATDELAIVRLVTAFAAADAVDIDTDFHHTHKSDLGSAFTVAANSSESAMPR